VFRPRVIPLLLLHESGLVKTVKFNKRKYIGDPINAVKIFNDFRADELIFVDISATKNNKTISLEFVKQVSEEAFMPFAVGGGIKTVKQACDFIKNGAEKIILDSNALLNPQLIEDCANEIGQQAVVVSIDVKKNFFGNHKVYGRNGNTNSNYSPIFWSKKVEEMGAGEILLTDISKDGMMQGYNLDLVRLISDKIKIPITCCGGAGNFLHFKDAINAGAHAVAAGSIFVYHGSRNAVLINYPSKEEINKIF
jgi:cyclase